MEELASRYRAVRAFTEALTEPLAREDMVLQSMPDASPTKWHLAHTSWFFEEFVLAAGARAYRRFHPGYAGLFNSYYQSVGAPFPRAQRGLLSRPTVEEVRAYRRHVDDHMVGLLARAVEPALAGVVELGLHHEDQHQELLLTDLAHAFSINPLRPAYRATTEAVPAGESAPHGWLAFDEGVVEIGHAGEGFAFDNEGPRHRVFLASFELATRPVTNGDLIAFVADGGYRRASLWHAEAWTLNGAQGRAAPLYWEERDDGFWAFGLAGLVPVDPAAAACHLSWFEASAYAEWAGARLPTEAEWEHASRRAGADGATAEDGRFSPRPLGPTAGALASMFGDVWEWTASSYAPYPGYERASGALGEYNGKFMSNQYVLRGGSCLTRRHHVRPTYRNFFPADARWQMSGLRLAR